MKEYQLTIRKVDSALHRRIVRSAKLKSQSMNEWVLDAIKAKAGVSATDGGHEASWKKHVGALDGQSISQETIEDFEQIDTNMW